MPLLQGLIFDLDGTLMDSAPDLRHALNATLQAHKRRELTIDEVKSLVGDGMLPLLSRAFAMTGDPISDSDSYVRFQEFISHYRTLKADPSQLYPHVLETIKTYFDGGVKLAICTNKQEAATHRLIADLQMTQYFSAIAGGDTFPTHKPHPGHVRGLLDQLKLPKENCVMVGDSRNDVMAAQGAGIPCLIVTQGYGFGVKELGANGLIDSFRELPQALEALGFKVR